MATAAKKMEPEYARARPRVTMTPADMVRVGREAQEMTQSELAAQPTDLTFVSYMLQQIDETKNGLFRVVANEIRDFLEHTNISSEMKKMLTTVQFEINTTVRFSPNDSPAAPSDETTEGGEPRKSTSSKPEVKTQVHVKREEPRPRRRSRE